MIKLHQLFLMAVIVVLSPLVFAETATTPDPDTVKHIVSNYMTKHGTPGVAVEIFIDGKPQSYYYGYAHQEKKTPITQKTIFELGSISKVMTSILLAENIDLAKTQLDVPVKKYLSYLSNDFDDITMQMLATHTAGLPFELPATIKTKKEADQYLSSFYPDYIAGEEWIYSNLGMGLLGEALEKVTRKNLSTLYRTQLLAPLGMQPIGIELPKALQVNMAQGYTSDGQPAAPVDTGFYPAGGAVKASAEDMRHFMSAAIGLPGTPETLFYPIRMTQAAYVKLPGYAQGLGWQIYTLPRTAANPLIPAAAFNMGPIAVTTETKQAVFNGDNLIEKTGSTNGFRAYIGVIPNKKTGIVILANKADQSSDIQSAGREILFALNHMNIPPSDMHKPE